MTRQSILSQGFDVLKLEEKIYKATQVKPYYEIDSAYDYQIGSYINSITANGRKIGEYHRDPWGQGWYGKSAFGGSNQRRFATDGLAISFIKRQYDNNR